MLSHPRVIFVYTVKILIFLHMALIASPEQASTQLKQLLDREWRWQQQTYPEQFAYLGDHDLNSRLTDYSLDAILKRQEHTRDVRKELLQIDRDLLSESDKLNYELFLFSLNDAIDAQKFPSHFMPVTQLWGPQIGLATLVSYTPFNNEQDFANYLQRLSAIGDYIDQHIFLMREGIKLGWMMPATPLRGVTNQIAAHANVSADSSAFYVPIKTISISLPPEKVAAIQTEGRQIVESIVLPAFARFYEFFKDEYLPSCLQENGAWKLPEGRDYYMNRAFHYTTTRMTPEEIHAVGESEVARIRAQMAQIIADVNFSGSFDDFLEFLRTDPQFYHTDPESLLTEYRDICKRIDPELAKLFGRLPRIPYGVVPIPDYEAPTSYTGYYSRPAADGSRAGFFYANTYKLEMRPRYEMEALAIHEAVPGHHLQIALALELEDLPEFRKHMSVNAFVEGWALYSESLGEVLGMYKNPYSKFGQLTYEMWRACRLVVDTGLHYFKWSRQQAIDFMLANTAKTEHDVTSEVDRYIVWPGQALGYKIGELRIKALRAKAEADLGASFDLRKFHDKVLEEGSLPLEILDNQVNEWINSEKKANEN